MAPRCFAEAQNGGQSPDDRLAQGLAFQRTRQARPFAEIQVLTQWLRASGCWMHRGVSSSTGFICRTPASTSINKTLVYPSTPVLLRTLATTHKLPWPSGLISHGVEPPRQGQDSKSAPDPAQPDGAAKPRFRWPCPEGQSSDRIPAEHVTRTLEGMEHRS